jgi:predicted secreted protein with PEFG-CTERM motif
VNIRKKSFIFVLSLIVSISASSVLSIGLIPNAYAQTGAEIEVGVERESKVDTGNLEVITKSEVEASAEAETKTSEEKSESETTSKSEMSAESTTQISIKTAYPKAKADSSTSFVVQSKNMLYTPGEKVKVQGSLWSSLFAQLGASNTVTIQILDASGKVVQEKSVQMRSDGGFDAEIILPESSVEGKYSIKSKIVSDSSVLDTLSAEAKAKLETKASVLVAKPNPVKIKVEGHDDFELKVASNSKVSNVKFVEAEKKVSFLVEGETNTKGVTKISIPKALLSGQLTVLIDGQVMATDKVIVTANTEATTTLELNYQHSVHTVEIVGTQAVPEFGAVALVVLAVAITGIIITASKKQMIRTI